MLVNARRLALRDPGSLVLLWHWREKFFIQSPVAAVGDPASPVTPLRVTLPGQRARYRRGPLPWLGRTFDLRVAAAVFTCIPLSR